MLSPQLLELLRLWWREGKRRCVMLPQGWLFPGRNSLEPISTRQINRAVHEAAEAAGIKKRVSPHTLRHYVSFLTMSGNVAGSAILMVSHRSQHVGVWRATRHSFLATSRSES
jgi:integrase